MIFVYTILFRQKILQYHVGIWYGVVMAGLTIGRWRQNGFYKTLDLQEYGFWVGQLISPELRKARGHTDNTYQCYFYRLNRLSHKFEADNWQHALMIACQKLHDTETRLIHKISNE